MLVEVKEQLILYLFVLIEVEEMKKALEEQVKANQKEMEEMKKTWEQRMAESQVESMVRKEGNVLFNDALNTFYLQLYGVGHMVKDHSDSERGNPLLPHGLLFPINSKGSFICTIPQTR